MAKELAEEIAEASQWVIECFGRGGKVLLFGNGGSAADAQHIATELVCRFQKERKALPALALSTNSSLVTAQTNDLGFKTVFSRQIEAWAKKGDIAIAISTSGNSPNILEGVKKAKELGMRTIGFIGKGGGELKNLVDLPLIVPSDDVPRIQEVHITIGHIICHLVEKELFK
ncbi:D-sedoheptulose 7-phosphate isomerase [bacterium]|nr:D-sedoheptulose 7-phosphate isomerase [bacterium]MCG2677579.1 D-sedoheptulose 7-phosphate isomerase [bacterium]